MKHGSIRIDGVLYEEVSDSGTGRNLRESGADVLWKLDDGDLVSLWNLYSDYADNGESRVYDTDNYLDDMRSYIEDDEDFDASADWFWFDAGTGYADSSDDLRDSPIYVGSLADFIPDHLDDIRDNTSVDVDELVKLMRGAKLMESGRSSKGGRRLGEGLGYGEDPKPLTKKQWKTLDELAYRFTRAYRCVAELSKAVDDAESLRGHVSRHDRDLYADTAKFAKKIFKGSWMTWDALNDMFIDYYEDNVESNPRGEFFGSVMDRALDSVGGDAGTNI